MVLHGEVQGLLLLFVTVLAGAAAVGGPEVRSSVDVSYGRLCGAAKEDELAVTLILEWRTAIAYAMLFVFLERMSTLGVGSACRVPGDIGQSGAWA